MISVIVCAFNEEKLIGQCLSSLRDLEFPNSKYEVLIIDDESTDSTPDIVQEFIDKLTNEDARFRFYRMEHGGLSIARNTGIQRAKGDIICFIDGDAIAHKNWLTEYALTFEEHDCHYSSGRIDLLNTDDHFAQTLQETRFRQSFKPPYSNHFHGVNMAFQRSVFEKYPGFFENFDSRGDDVSYRSIVARDFNYCPSPNATVIHERPDSFKSWYKVYKKELRLQYLVKKAVAKYGVSSRYLIPLLKATAIDLCLLLGFLDSRGWLLAAILFMISKRRQLFKRYRSIESWVFVLSSTLIDTLLKPVYFLLSYLKYKNEDIINPHTTKTEVLLSLSNRAK